MKDLWTGELVGKMHVAEVTLNDLANEVGFSKGYVSMILNGIKKPTGAREKLEQGFNAIMKRRSEADGS